MRKSIAYYEKAIQFHPGYATPTPERGIPT